MIQALIAFGLLILLMPVLLFIALIQMLVFGKVFFKQLRLGRNNVSFKIYKFQSMKSLREGLSEKERLNFWGRFLRHFSLDELPQLINVVKGDMLFIGPRPLLPQYQERYTAQQARRVEMKPGITGWAQVKGRNAITWEEQLELDVWYVDNHSLKIDIQILFVTFQKVFRGASNETNLREEFKGEQ